MIQLVVLLALVVGIRAVGFEVPAHQTECFWEPAAPNSAITVVFQVTQGGFLDIDISVTSPDGRTLYSGQRETSGHFSLVAPVDGKYKFCFSNQMSTVSSKVVVADIVIRKPDHQQQKEEKDAEGVLTSLTEQLRILQTTTREMTLDFNYLQARENAHTNTIASTGNRVYNWAMFEIVTLIVMTFLQLFYLRAFFDKSNSHV